MGNGSPRRLLRQIALRPSARARLGFASVDRQWPVTAARSGDLPPLQLSLCLRPERPG